MTNALSSPLLSINSVNAMKLTMNENIKIFVYNETQFSNENVGTIPIDADTILEIYADFYISDKDVQLKINSIQMLSFEVKKSLIGDINVEDVKTKFNNLINLYLSQINNQIKAFIDDLKKQLINDENINFSEIYAKSYENYIKFDISPILMSLFHLIYY